MKLTLWRTWGRPSATRWIRYLLQRSNYVAMSSVPSSYSMVLRRKNASYRWEWRYSSPKQQLWRAVRSRSGWRSGPEQVSSVDAPVGGWRCFAPTPSLRLRDDIGSCMLRWRRMQLDRMKKHSTSRASENGTWPIKWKTSTKHQLRRTEPKSPAPIFRGCHWKLPKSTKSQLELYF